MAIESHLWQPFGAPKTRTAHATRASPIGRFGNFRTKVRHDRKNAPAEKGLAQSGELGARKAAWKRAFLNTPYGQPVVLGAGEEQA